MSGKQKHFSLKSNKTQPWRKIPKWLLPIVVILLVILIYFIAQYVASFILSLYALSRGWNAATANNWLNQSITGQFFFILIFEGCGVGLVWLLMHRYGKSLATLGLKRLRLRDVGYALLAYPVYLILFIIAIKIVQVIFPSFNLNQGQNIGFNSVHGAYQMTLTFFSLVVLPPFAEELLFRGLLFEGLKKSMPVIYAGLLTSALFAVAHLPEGTSGLFWVGAIDVFILSLVLVYLKQKTKSLWPGIFLHAFKNLIAFISLFLLTNR